MQTMGNLLPPPAQEERKVTRTDAILSVPFATQLLAKLGEVGFGQDILGPAAYDMGPMDDLRTAGLVMMQGSYQSWRITVQLGGGDRQGEILIAMRPQIMTAPATTDAAPKWSEALRDALQDAPADLKTVLSRMTLPMSKIEEFEVGQVIQLAGTTVGSVSLVGPGGEQIAMARLGQVAGKRAVRVEVEVIELQDDTPKVPPVVAPSPELDTLVK